MSSEDDLSKFEKFKQHLKDNKKVYFVGAGCLTAGYFLRPKVVNIVDVFNFKYKSPTTTDITTIVIQPRGNPGDVVMRVRDGMRWPSKNEMARDLGVPRWLITAYFQGKVGDINGDTYVDLGKAGQILAVPQNPVTA